ncbi:MAG: hypothetical protein NTX51_07110 [Verrucomicrobia bacterium]|nr:hypothetical protein [Verrucomicrobiota bacterium]
MRMMNSQANDRQAMLPDRSDASPSRGGGSGCHFVMTMPLEVTWVILNQHPDPRQRVGRMGGLSGDQDWAHGSHLAVQYIEAGVFSYYVAMGNGRTLPVRIGCAPDGIKFLQAQWEGESANLLLSLARLEPGAQTNPIVRAPVSQSREHA